jgi:hypothetical protein
VEPNEGNGKGALADAAAAPRRALRDRPLGRVLLLAAVLAAAALAARSCADTSPDVSKEAAIESAREIAVFEPESVQVRFVRRGVPSRGYWAVSLYQGPARQPTRVQLVVVDANTGDVVDDGLQRQP